MSVTRYEEWTDGMRPDNEGKYVLHSDYEKLEKQVKELANQDWETIDGLQRRLAEVEKQRDDLLAATNYRALRSLSRTERFHLLYGRPLTQIMSEKTTKEKLHDLIKDQLQGITLRTHEVDFDSIENSTRWHEDLKMDSLDDVEMIMAIEEEFGVEIDDAEAAAMLSVGDTIRILEAKLA